MSDSESEAFHDESDDFVESDGGESDDGDAVEEAEEDDFGTPKKKASKAAKAKPTATATKKAPAKKAAAAAAVSKAPKAASTAAPAASMSAGPVQASASKMVVPKAVRTEGEAERVILDYMTRQNRPYSLLNVVDNLHKAVAKPVAQRVLDKLADKGELIKKDYGKNRIYCVNQDKLGADFTPADMAAMTTREAAAKQQFAEISNEASALSKQLTSLTAEPTDNELDSELARLQAEVDEKQGRVSNLSGAKPVDPKQRTKALADLKKYRSAWIERKRKATDFMEVMSENMNKKMKDVADLMGLETDESVGVRIPDAI